MKTEKYSGLFRNDDGHQYILDVYCNGFIQAFFLLTADAIRSGKHYQLYSIVNDENIRYIRDIIEVSNLIK